ncbi:cell cycle progression protein 1 [Canis lupus baileyi]|uniref:Cell cycle progression 1 n=1 Tax=Canis lupus dingo TaxID=286419 RepID=A0A8C0KI27_CANLU|nr:cell cycle progression protein 1 [Canis lupus dingo]XP_038298314.1 cell cycle progression protein 1 isoform X5 [Canis lupus familiaris]XP_038436399.1 cell cycle progression protein 1 isoform X5 [Canis lupus familiaris]XP_544691.2 cell cycle progression protein 1 isoform X5 [Canis lupus familiaris]|eukprot:XP_544691.2 cell cycle progression protein 1 [Canis lupus familiaris]
MSENSSDSDSSCGWTVINHEGSDIEMVNSEHGTASDSCELAPECTSLEQEELQVLQSEPGESSQNGTPLMGEAAYPALEETKSALEREEEKSSEDNVYFGTVSDDSDIVTLEPPKLEEIGNPETLIVEEAQSPEDLNMGSSSSSQYTFCQPETVFSSQPSDDESSSDETSHQPSPAFRRRRARKKTVSSSESEERLLPEQESEPSKELCKRQFSSGLNKCVILALVIAISMGFGHFYGTIQIQKRQQLVRKIHEDELNDMKDYLSQCQQEQESFIDYKALKEKLARCWALTEEEKMSFETQKKNLATENQYLRISLEKEEKALSLLQEELRKLREQIRILEDKGTGTELISENRKLKQHLEEEKLKTHSFLNQKETLLSEAKMLRRELERERLITMALKVELQQLSSSESYGNPDSPNVATDKKEMEILRERLTDLEQKLNFEQQRSDLWERLYIEAKDQNAKQEMDGKKKGSRGNHRAKNKPKETFLGSVKETFDAMKNSTKEFVRHHKEKIKQAKEAVKENLKKFSDSVKSTFRHFKDTTKNIFDEKGNKRFGATKEEATKKPPVFSEYIHPQYKARTQNQNRGPTMKKEGRKEKPIHFEEFRKNTNSQKCSAEHDCSENYDSFRKSCSGIFECAQQESINLFNMKVLNPVKIDEFRQLIERYLLEKLDSFHHWKELDQFINKFFLNGVFIHDQKLFTDFVNDVKDYLKDMKEYQVDNDGVFEKLDGFIYRHFFGHTLSPPYGPSRPDKKQRMVNIENSRHRKQEQKHPQPQPYKREGKWHKYGRTNGRHMANLEIELGQLPFDPKY